jgi:hypothetical protein
LGNRSAGSDFCQDLEFEFTSEFATVFESHCVASIVTMEA